MSKLYVGKENAKKVFNKKQQRYSVYWFDPETLQRKNESYSRWWWEINKGEIPEGYRASYKDGNSANVSPENIILKSPEEYGKEISGRLMGHGFSEETLKKMSDKKKGISLSEEHKKNIGEATKKMWQDGVFDTPEIREAYYKQGKSTKGSKRTEEQKKKMSEKSKGKTLPESAYTPESIEKRRVKLLGKHHSKESNEKRSKSLRGRKFTPEHLENLSISGRKRKDNHGDNSHWWKGGIANVPYPDEFSDYLKKKIRRRDGYKCQSCGMSVYGSKFGHVHHINANKQDCSEENLILLCATCHSAVHYDTKVTSPKIEELKGKL
jgi:hypothetical protein